MRSTPQQLILVDYELKWQHGQNPMETRDASHEPTNSAGTNYPINLGQWEAI